MALNDMQLQAIQESEDIESGKDTRTKSEMIADQMAGLQSTGEFIAENTPVVGEVILAKEISDDVAEGNYASAGLGTAALGVGLLPGGDILNKPIKAAAKKFRKADTVDETVDTMSAAGLDADAVANWRKTNATSEDFRKSLKGRNPILIDLANARKANEITAKEYREAADAFRPIRTVQDVPEPATTTELVSALGKKSEKGVLGVNRNIPDGDRITARLDINAYTDYDVWIPTLTHPDKKTMYSPTVVLRDVSFIHPDDKAVDMALNVATGKAKAPFAVMEGNYQSMPDSDAFEYAKEVFDDASWTQVGYDPTRRGFFYDRKTGQPVLNAEEVVQVGHLVLAKNAVKGNADDFTFNEGGVVPMKEQMEMFNEGGLKDEGGTVDPVSGNDVPPGSTQEEVRDDIPAQLSEGEFVFPADVVRFIGLNKLMQMRQEAKMGLKMMDEMGQMGNSDEATIPDDIPFSIADLVVVTSDKEDVDTEDKKEYNTGGLASNFGVTYQAPQFQSTTTVGQAAPIPTAPVYTPAAQQSVPVAQPPQTLPTGQEFLTAEQAAPQTITIVNEETGEERVITFIPGVTQIPQGFVRKEDYTPKEVVPEVPSTTVQTAQVTEGRGDDDRQKKEEEMYGPGGGRVGVGGEIYGVSFDMPEGSLLPGVGGIAATAFGLATGKPLPENTVVNFKRGEVEFSVTGKQYNEFKAQAQESGYNSKEAKQKFDRMMAESSAKDAEEARKKKEAAMEAIKNAADAAARKEAEKEKQRQQAIEQQKLKQLSEANINSMYGRSEDRNERQEQQAQNQREADTFTREAVSDVAGRGASGRGFNKGGDVTEQMKKSGLSSKK